MEVKAVDLEVKPVERKCLEEAEDGFAEEGVDAKGGVVFVEQGDDGVAEDEGDEGAGAFDLVLDVGAGEELELLLGPFVYFGAEAHPGAGALPYHNDAGTEEVEEDGDPDESLPVWLFDVDATDPKNCWDNDGDGICYLEIMSDLGDLRAFSSIPTIAARTMGIT
jgi:hypothetical protein